MQRTTTVHPLTTIALHTSNHKNNSTIPTHKDRAPPGASKLVLYRYIYAVIFVRTDVRMSGCHNIKMVHPAKQQKAEQSRRAPAKAHGTQQTKKAAKQKMVHPVKQQKAEQSSRALRKHMVRRTQQTPSGSSSSSTSYVEEQQQPKASKQQASKNKQGASTFYISIVRAVRTTYDERRLQIES